MRVAAFGNPLLRQKPKKGKTIKVLQFNIWQEGTAP